MLLNCSVGEDSWESLGLKGDPTSLSERKRTRRPGMLWFMGLKRVRHDQATELNWNTGGNTQMNIYLISKTCNYFFDLKISHTFWFLCMSNQAGFRKGRGTRDQIANICWITEKRKGVPEKHLFLHYWLCQSLWLCGSQQTVENFERDGNTRPPDLPLEKPVCRSGSNS